MGDFVEFIVDILCDIVVTSGHKQGPVLIKCLCGLLYGILLCICALLIFHGVRNGNLLFLILGIGLLIVLLIVLLLIYKEKKRRSS